MPDMQVLDALIPLPMGVGGRAIDAVVGPILGGLAKAGAATGRVGTGFAKLAVRGAAGALKSGARLVGKAGQKAAGYAGKMGKALANAAGGRLNPFNYRAPAGELYSGIPRLVFRPSKGANNVASVPGPANVRIRTGSQGELQSAFSKIESHNIGGGFRIPGNIC